MNTYIVPTIRVPQPGGAMLLKPGPPILLSHDFISTTEASRLLGLSPRSIQHMCEDGTFRTAHRPGRGATARWRISRAEVLARLPNGGGNAG